jgi:general secretion pathway protein A
LATRLNHPTLLHLKQRVALRAVLAPLDQTDTAAYIETRLRVAGWDGGEPLFTPNAIAVIYNHSGGIPRTISVICDNALVAGFAIGRRPVGPDIVLEVCRDLDFAAVRPERTVRPQPAPERRLADTAPRPAPVAQPWRRGRTFDVEAPAPGGGSRATEEEAGSPAARLRIVFRSFRRQLPITLFGESR